MTRVSDRDLSGQTCDHNSVPCRGGLRHLFRAGWVCVRCGEWGRKPLPRLCPDCAVMARHPATYVDGSQDDLTRDLDVIADILFPRKDQTP